ncbi:MAG: ABC transporter ATP-binding protein [Nitrospirae bacterium]|nr:ABC transporter ATP-binding protein [Nitrospirota bacterium]
MIENKSKQLELVMAYIEHRHNDVVSLLENQDNQGLFDSIIGLRSAMSSDILTDIEKFYENIRKKYFTAFAKQITYHETFYPIKEGKWYDFMEKVHSNYFANKYVCFEMIAKRDDSSDYIIELHNAYNSETFSIHANSVRIISNGDDKRIWTDKWNFYHCVLSRKGTKVYVNGSLLLSSTLLNKSKGIDIRFTSSDESNSDYISQLIYSMSVYVSPYEFGEYSGTIYDLFEFQYDYADLLYQAGYYDKSADEFINLAGDSIQPEVKTELSATVKEIFLSEELPLEIPFAKKEALCYVYNLTAPKETIIRTKTGASLTMLKALIEVKGLGIRFPKNPAVLSNPIHLIRRMMMRKQAYHDKYSLWVFRNVDFTLYSGDILGVIGPNGAGKSTMLRVLAGLVNYNEGEVIVRSNPILLQQSIGLRPYYSGYDNIFFILSYYGFTRKEIKQYIPEIIEFSELGEAIYRPCNYYSSGMIGRLTFSIATTIVPEVLMLDELLGAGDAKFREKATLRMFDLIERSKLVVVVSHNLGFIRNNCTKALYINNGSVRFLGDPRKAVDMYLMETNPSHKIEAYGKQDLNAMFTEEL